MYKNGIIRKNEKAKNNKFKLYDHINKYYNPF